MRIRGITKADFDHIVSVMDNWWGGLASERAHPVFFYELGAHALIAEDDDRMTGFLLGFIAPSTPPTAYVHLVGIDPDCRRKGVARELYGRFIERCRAAGARRVKAIAPVGNEGSAAFHRALGFEVTTDADYAGPGRARMVMTRRLEGDDAGTE